MQVRRALAVLAAAALAVSPLAVASAPASASALTNRSFVIGGGDHADIAVGADGTAYVAWVHESAPGLTDQIQFCRVPRGKLACTGLQTFTLQGQQTGQRPYVFLPGGDEVLVLSYRCCFTAAEAVADQETELLLSQDGGVTFKTPQLIGTHSAQGDAVLGRNGTVYTINDIASGGVSVQRDALDGSATPLDDAAANLGGDEFGGTLAALGSGAVLAAHWDITGSTDTVRVSRFSGAGDPNAAASWSTVFAGSGQNTLLATGKKGAYLLTQQSAVFPRFQLRTWTGTTFAAPVFLNPARQDNVFPAFWEDASGRLSLAYSNSQRVVTYRTSTAKGFATALALKATQAFDLRGATAADGGGFVAYDGNSASGVVSLVPIPAPRVVTESVTKRVLAGKVAPFRAKQPVVLERSARSGWVAVATHALGATGKYVFTLPAAAGKYRVVAPAVEGFAEADGAPIVR